MGRRRDHGQVQFLFRQHLPDVFVPARDVVSVGHPVAQFPDRIAHGDELQVVEGFHDFDVAPTPAAASDKGGS